MLTVGIFQKDRRATAGDRARPLSDRPGVRPRRRPLRRDAVTLALTKAKYMDEDIGAFAISPTLEMAQKAVLKDMAISVRGPPCELSAPSPAPKEPPCMEPFPVQ